MPTLTSAIGSARRLATSRSGVLGLTTVGNLALRLMSSLILTRLLMPEAFGMVGIISSVFFVVAMLTDLGFQAYVVRDERGDDPHFLDVIWTIHAWRGVLLSAICMAGAPLIARIMDKPSITWPLAVTSLTLAIGGFSSLSLITALRNDGARKLALMDLGLGIVQLVANVILAVVLRNVWSLVIAMLLYSVVKLILSYTLFPNPAQRLRRDSVISRDFFAFSRVIMASSAITLVVSQMDKLVLGRLFTLTEFGLYGLALNLALAPVGFADGYIMRVVYPIYSATFRRDPAAISSVYYACRWQTSLLYGFGVGCLIGGGGLLVDVLYDPRYHQAGVFLSVLAIGSAIRLPSFAVAELITAFGEVKGTLRGNVARLVWLLLLAPLAYWRYGALGLVMVVALIELPAFAFNSMFARRYGALQVQKELVYFLTVGSGVLITLAISSVMRDGSFFAVLTR